jgi:predicted DsbA family dithiol-disulfide isomerase
MEALLWSDYLCPWCWLGRDRSAIFEAMGVTVTHLPYDLHPEVPPAGRPVRPGGRLDTVFQQIGAECALTGVEFRAPTRTPNTRQALETAEVVRLATPEAFGAVDEAFFRAHWVEGLDLGDPDLLDEIVAAAGAPLDEVRDRRADGDGRRSLEQSMARAREHGVTATPAWLVNGVFLIPGVQSVDTIRRWVGRLLDRDRTDE